jgi:hypothetical protein
MQQLHVLGTAAERAVAAPALAAELLCPLREAHVLFAPAPPPLADARACLVPNTIQMLQCWPKHSTRPFITPDVLTSGALHANLASLHLQGQPLRNNHLAGGVQELHLGRPLAPC